MFDSSETQLADVEHALNAANVDECAVWFDRRDNAIEHFAWLQAKAGLFGQLVGLFFE